jgi:hypothetical protein
MQPFFMVLATVLLTAGCSPSVRMEAPEKPIEINMNVKIEHEIRVQVERDIEQMLNQNKDLF